MPQPADIEAAADELIRLYRTAQTTIETEAIAAATSPNRRARLAELRRTIDAELANLERSAAAWLETDLPAVYAAGGQQAAGSGAAPWSWNQTHQEAVLALARDTWDDVLTAHTALRAEARAWIRQVGRRETALSLLEGRTAQQAARSLTRLSATELQALLGGPVGLIPYRDGSYRRLDDYADTLLRTKTAMAYNAGTLNHLGQSGITYVEVFDGTDCGWTSHQDADKPNGTIRRLQDAAEHPLSHPRCRRSFGGRPDVQNAGQAASATPSTTVDQRADQAATERDRERAFAERRRARQARERRKARQPQPPRRPPPAKAARKPRTPRPAAPATPAVGRPPSLTTPASRITFEGPARKWQPLLDQLGDLHGMPDDGLPNVHLVAGGKTQRRGGYFHPAKRPPKPKRTRGKDWRTHTDEMSAWRTQPTRMEIRVNDRGTGDQAVSLLHELGHRIDWNGRSFLSETPGLLTADEASAMADFLTAARDTPTISTAYQRYRQPSYVAYYRDPKEVWARAYSQWASNRLGGPAREALDAMHRNSPGYQWPDEEFSTLGPLVERVLRARGLML